MTATERAAIFKKVRPRLLALCHENVVQGNRGYAKVLVNRKMVPYCFHFVEDETADDQYLNYKIKFMEDKREFELRDDKNKIRREYDEK